MSFLKLFFKKTSSLLFTLFFLSLLVFLLIHLLPGDPAKIMLGERATEESLKAVRIQLGLDKPLYQQYFSFLKDLAINQNLGTSIKSGELISTEIKRKFPATLELTFIALFISSFFGVILGIIAAIKRGTRWDFSTMFLALAGVSMPVFWLALLLIWFFSIKLQWLPITGRIDPLIDFDSKNYFYLLETLMSGNFEALKSSLKHIVLPACALATIPMSMTARFTRATMLETLGQDYIRTAKAKGLNPLLVIFKHALRNALIPIITVVGLQFGSLLGGAIITESIFSWPGVGTWLLDSIYARDFPAMQGAILMIGASFIIINYLVDLSYLVIDPKLRKSTS